MKWSIALSVLSGTAALAVPLTERTVPTTTDVYKLRISAKGNAGLDGRYLSVKNNTVGYYGLVATPVQVYLTKVPNSGPSDVVAPTYQLHTYPIGIMDHLLGLVGSADLQTFTDIALPSAQTNYNATFLLNQLDDNVRVMTNGHWIAYPAGDQTSDVFGAAQYTIMWRAGAIMPTIDMPVDILYEKVGNTV